MPTGGLSAHTARTFADRYAAATSEKQLAQSFWRDFFTQVCEVDDLLSAGIEFEHPVKSVSTGKVRFIDVLWPGVVLIEHKSAGQDLDRAEAQARDYLVSLHDVKRPPVFIVSDFARIRIIDIFADQRVEFALADLPANLGPIEALLSGAAERATQAQVAADTKAANLMSDLFVAFDRAGYEGHEVSVFLVRMLFLLFGDDTRMWRQHLFQGYVGSSPEDGTGLGGMLAELFQVLNTPLDRRSPTLSSALADFPYVNGGLFAEPLPVFSFTPAMREALVTASGYDWASISPALFGSMFQTVKSKEARRELGEHYTSEANILKALGPLFLTDLNDRLREAWDSPAALTTLRNSLADLVLLDPACGCGNFLLVAYKRLRELELKIIARQGELAGSAALTLDGSVGLRVHLGQFHGIEHEEWSAQIASVAMYLADHQANLAAEEMTGLAHSRFPLSESAHIVHADALSVDWAEVCPMTSNTVIVGNPPFLGSSLQSPEQKAQTRATWKGVTGAGNLDYVTNWYALAARHLAPVSGRAAFVSTNSITQGEQPAVMWGPLYAQGVGIDFAHRTFAWSNDAPGQAAVHCVIIGFSTRVKLESRPMWFYKAPSAEPELRYVRNINAYLLDAPDVLVRARSRPIGQQTQRLDYGSKPTDDGFLSNISPEEAERIRASDPIAAKYLRRIIGAREMLHDDLRYCLWLVDAPLSDLRASPELSRRVAAVRDFRRSSTKAKTVEDGDRPSEFQEVRQPRVPYLAVPLHTSLNRDYLAIARYEPEVIASNAVSVIEDPSLVTFGVLSSRVFAVWNKAVSGRIKSDTRVSGNITYNNFPFPDLTPEETDSIETAADHILTARESFPHNSLADLYDPVMMPEQLRRAHRNNDRVVLAVFGLPADATDEEILAVLFERYEALSAAA